MIPESAVCIAVCRRVNRVAFAVVSNNLVYDVCGRRAGRREPNELGAIAMRLADAYGAKLIVTEPGVISATTESARVIEKTIDEAKQVLCGSDASTHHDLIQAVIARQPNLKSFVAEAKFTGDNAKQSRWRLLPLLSIALGLAFLQP